MIMHFQTWDNGKYGQIWRVDDDDFSWKFTEIVNGCASDEDFEKSPIIASHFIGYCAGKLPEGEGDIYTPFFTYYYNIRMERYRKKHKGDISLIRDPQRLEKQFLQEHINEEKQGFETSKALSDYNHELYVDCLNLYYGYMAFLEEKWPFQFVFHEYTSPKVFSWREFDKVSVDFQNTEIYLDRVVELSLGRVFPVKGGGYLITDEDKEQIKTVYGATCKMDNVFFIYYNTTDRKRVAEAVYDIFMLDMAQRKFHNPTEKQLALEHAKRWISGFLNKTEPVQSIDFDIIKHQLKRE